MLITTFATLTASPANACQDDTQTTSYSTEVILSEIYPAPPSGEEEFIELYNAGTAAVDLTDWTLGDASGKTYTLETTIAAGSYLSIPHSASAIYLNNSGDSVTLAHPNGTIIDDTTYEEADSGKSWALLSSKWQWTNQVTEAAKNSAGTGDEGETESDSNGTEQETDNENYDQQTDYQTSKTIFINELLPDPEGLDTTDEWIELINEGAAAVNLTGWQLTDTSTYYPLDGITLNSEEILLVEAPDSKIGLNNSGDTIYLIDPFDEIIHGTTYDTAGTGVAWARTDDDWQWTTTPTPGETNSISENEEDTEESAGEGEEVTNEETDRDIIDISLFRELEDDATASVSGIVTVEPGVLGSQYFYIQDDSAGIQVYSYKKDFPDIAVGDTVTITGTKSTSRGETRIKTTTAEEISVTGSGEPVPVRDITELAEEFEGMLVQTEGTVTEIGSSGGMINDTVELQFKEGANIDSTILTEGEGGSVIGITTESSGNYRLLPRSNDDLTATESETEWISAAEAAGTTTSLPSTKEPPSYGLLILVVVGLGAIIAGQFIKTQVAAKATPPHPKLKPTQPKPPRPRPPAQKK